MKNTPERHFPERTLDDSAPLPARKLHAGGHWGPINDHTGRKKREEGGMVSQRRRRNDTRKREESVDLNSAFSRRKSASDGAMDWLAVRSHPWRGVPSSMSTSRNCSGRTPANSSQECAWNPADARCSPEVRTPAKWKEGVLGVEGVHDASANGWVSVVSPHSSPSETCGQLRPLWCSLPNATSKKKEQPGTLEFLNGEPSRRQLGTNKVWVSQWCAIGPLVVDSGNSLLHRCPMGPHFLGSTLESSCGELEWKNG